MASIAPSQRVDVLVLGASPPDLRGLRTPLGENLAGVVRGLFVTAKCVGIGMGAAGPAAAKRVFQLEPRAVVHLGTCGIYPGLDGYRPHDVMIATSIQLVDHAVSANRAAFPDPMQTNIAMHPMLTEGLAASGGRAHKAKVATTPSMTIDDTLAADVPQRHGAHAENLEAFAIAHACQLAQVPFAVVLGATHVVGSYGREDWSKFERQSTLSAAEVVTTWLLGGAQGIPHG